MSNKRKLGAILGVTYLVLAILTIAIPIKPENKIKIIYNFDLPLDISGKLILQCPNEQKEFIEQADDETKRLSDLTYYLGEDAAEANNISIELYHRTPESYVRAIEFYNHGIQIKRLAPKEILEYFDMDEGNSYRMEGPYLIVSAKDEMPTIVGNGRLQEELPSILYDTKRIKCNILVLVTLLLSIVAVVSFRWEKMKESLTALKLEVSAFWRGLESIVQCVWSKRASIAIVALVSVQFFILLMAVKSRIYEHPDEDVTRMAIDYYLGGWLRPACDSSWMAGTFSDLGCSRLTEPTWYYFLAGKLGWLIERLTHLTTYYRMLNVIMFGVMLVMVCRHGRKEKWMFVVLLFCPELWYIFSYATSDAWDFLWAFVITYELLHENSMLNHYLEEKRLIQLGPILFIGISFAIVLQAKKNFYCILLFAFFNLLFRLFSVDKEKIIKLILKYGLILLTTFLAFQVKVKGLDQIANHVGNVNVLNESQSVEKIVPLKDLDISLQEVIFERGAAKSLLRSFVGRYGWMGSYDVSEPYMFFMFLLYLTFILILLYYIVKDKDKKNMLESLAQLGVCFLMLIAVFIQCWTGDFQPQGRYLLPMLPVIGAICAKNKKVFSNVAFNIVVFLITLGGLYSYIFVGVKNLVIPYL